MAFIDNVNVALYVGLFPPQFEESIWVGSAEIINSTEVVPFAVGADKFIVFFVNPKTEDSDDFYAQFAENYPVHQKSRIVKFVNLKSLEEQERLYVTRNPEQIEVKHFEKGAWPLSSRMLIFQLLEVLTEVMLYHSDTFLCEEYYYLPAHEGLQKAYERAYSRCTRASLMFDKIAVPSESVLGYRKLKASNDPQFEQHEKSESERSGLAATAENSGQEFASSEDLRAYFTGEISD